MIQEKIIDQTLVVTNVVTETVIERLILSDATAFEDGTTWTDLRDEAMLDGFTNTSTFIDFSTTDKELALALIEYENAKVGIVYNISETQTSTDLSELTRNTLIDGETWASRKGNKGATSYNDLSEADQIAVIALTEIQTTEDAAGREFANPNGTDMREFTATVTTNTRTGPIGDETQVTETTNWAMYKTLVDPMQVDFQESVSYLSLDAA